GGSSARGIQQLGLNLELRHSTVVATQGTQSFGLDVDTALTSGVAKINNSVVVGDTNYIRVAATCSVSVAASQLNGGTVTGGGTSLCAGVINAAYGFLPSTCP